MHILIMLILRVQLWRHLQPCQDCFELTSNRAERRMQRGKSILPVFAVEPCKAVRCQLKRGFWFLKGETANHPEDGAAAVDLTKCSSVFRPPLKHSCKKLTLKL